MVFPFIAVGAGLILTGLSGLFVIKRGEEYAEEHPEDPSWYPGKEFVQDVGPGAIGSGIGLAIIAVAALYLLSRRH